MKILYIHQYFKTPEEGGAIRSYYLATALVKSGHEVHLITSSNKYKGKKTIEGVKVYYLPIVYDNNFGFAKRIWAFLKFTILAYFQTVKIKNIEICYATSTPLSVGIIALVLKKINKIPFHFEVRDLWPKVPIDMGYIRNSLFKHLLLKLESSIYRNAERIVSLSPGISDYIKYSQNLDTVFIPNISDCNFFQSNPRSVIDSKINIAYIGSIGKSNNLTTLLSIAKHCLMSGISDINFLIAGDGAEKDLILSEIKEGVLNNVNYVGTLNKFEIKDLLRKCDAVYVSFAYFQILSTCSPNKFFDGLAAGKIIITNTQGWITDLIIASECGFFVDRKMPQTFTTKVIPFLRNPETRIKMQNNAILLAKSQFDRPLLEKKFLELFETRLN